MIIVKICKRCKAESNNFDPWKRVCKTCFSEPGYDHVAFVRQDRTEYAREYRQSENGKAAVERVKLNSRERNRLKAAEYRRLYPEKVKASRKSGRARVRQYEKEKRANDPLWKVKHNLRARVVKMIQNGYKSLATVELLGCSFEDFMRYIESLWRPGMTWSNYGLYKKDKPMTWHIDHVKPCASFNLLDPEEQRKCFHFSNLQPLWAIDNLVKGSTVKT